MKLYFCSLSSGSSGNCYYVGNEFHGILIDIGISAGSVKKFLKCLNISTQSIMGVLITHNHSDHIRGLPMLAKKLHIPVFTTSNIWSSILNSVPVSTDCIREINVRTKFNLAGFVIEAFPVCHDAPETVGYNISYGNKAMTIATDLGHVCSDSAGYLQKANLLVIESNYDENMLMTGGYPYYLKKRILSDHGHLGNLQTSEFLASMYNENINHICLAHLSRNNNTPELALQTLKTKFSEKRIDLACHQTITVLNRNTPTEIISLDC